MHLTLVQLSKPTRVRGFFTGLVLVTLVLALGSSPQASKGAWTRPISLAEGARHNGFQSTLVGDSILVVTTVLQTGSKVFIRADEFTADGRPFRERAMQLETEGLIGYSLTSDSDQYLIVWAEMLDTTFRLYMQSSVQYEKVLIRESESNIKSVTAAINTSGTLAVVWTDNSQGLHSVYAQTLNLDTRVVSDPVRVSSLGQLSLDPVVVWSDDVLHVVYKEQEHIFTNVNHRAMELGSMAMSEPLRIRRTNVEAFEMPVCVSSGQGNLDMFWPTDVQSRGLTRGSVLMKGSISRSGLWLDAPNEVAQFNGSTNSVTVTKVESGETMIVLANNQSGSFQLYSLLVNSEPSLVTYGTRHRFGPQAYYVNGENYVLFNEIREVSVEVFLVKYVLGSQIPLAVRLGLDPEAPLLDGIFKGTTILVSATVLAFLALGSIMIAAWMTKRLSSTSARTTPGWSVMAPHIMVYAILAILKRYGGYLYYGAVFVPGLSGALISLGSVVFALGVVTMLQLDKLDVFTLGVSGYMWVFADAFCSIYVRGAGLW